jgi:hypothetical protein
LKSWPQNQVFRPVTQGNRVKEYVTNG